MDGCKDTCLKWGDGKFLWTIFFGRKLAGGQVEMFTARCSRDTSPNFTPDNQSEKSEFLEDAVPLGGSYM